MFVVIAVIFLSTILFIVLIILVGVGIKVLDCGCKCSHCRKYSVKGKSHKPTAGIVARQAVLKFLCRFFRYFVISSLILCHFSAYYLCLFWFFLFAFWTLLFASFKVRSFHFYSYLSGILCLFLLLSLIR